jgi:hypothetical protein
LRIYLVQDSTLKTIGKMIEQNEVPDWEQTIRFNGIPPEVIGYFKKRFKYLGIMYKHCERLKDSTEKANNTLFVASVGMAFPAPTFDTYSKSSRKRNKSKRRRHKSRSKLGKKSVLAEEGASNPDHNANIIDSSGGSAQSTRSSGE